jgi:thiamine biosynthesis lipoprotein
VTVAPAPVAAAGGAVRLAIDAMGTRFELVLFGTRAVGEEALSEITRLESRLSRFRPGSDISWINAQASHRAVKVEPALLTLLRRAKGLSAATGGAFDMTVGPLMRLWNFEGAAHPTEHPGVPSPDLVAGARKCVGYQHLRVDVRASTVRFERKGMSIDLGAIGKGYAIDAAIEVLREHGITRALLHGGTSSVHAIGSPPDADAWRIPWEPRGSPQRVFELRDSALSVSAVHGKSFELDGREYGHVMDPRTGAPTTAARSALVTGPSSLECDALSTALLVLGPPWLPSLRRTFPGYHGYAG